MLGKFNGNGVFMQDGRAVIPAGATADRLQAGEFGPHPNATAPPGFRIPDIVAALQNTQPQGQAQAGPEQQESWIDAMTRYNAYKALNGVGSAGYFNQGYADADLEKIRAMNPGFGQKNPVHDGGW